MQLAEVILSSHIWGSFVTPGRCGKIQTLKLMVGFADCEGCPFPILLEIDLAKQQSRNPLQNRNRCLFRFP